MNPITLFLVIACALVGLALGKTVDLFFAPPFLVAAVIIALSLKMANAWQKFVVLRAGKLQGVKGPGLFLIFPIIDNVAAVIDERIQTTAFNAEQALTKDTVPVNVDAIIFWHVHDARKAALEITDYRQAIDRVAQTSLREMIGSSMLAALLSDRKAADGHLRDEIGNKCSPAKGLQARGSVAEERRLRQFLSTDERRRGPLRQLTGMHSRGGNVRRRIEDTHDRANHQQDGHLYASVQSERNGRDAACRNLHGGDG